jgi:hypothetical protein
MKFLHVVNSFDPAGDVTRCVRLLKIHSKHQHEVIVKQRHPYRGIYQFEEPLLIADKVTPQLVKDLFDWCDGTIYHFLGWESGWQEFSKPAAFRNSNIYFQKNSGRFFCMPHYSASDLSRYKLLASSHIGAGDFLPDCRLLPALIPVDEDAYAPDWSDRTPCISYAKDAHIFDGLHFGKGIQKQNLLGTPHKTLLDRRRKEASMVIDNITDGHYGLAGFEALSMGLPAIVFNHEKTKKALRDMAPEYPPLWEVEQRHEAVAVKARAMVNYGPELRWAARRWMLNYYNPARLIEMYWDKFCEELVNVTGS